MGRNAASSRRPDASSPAMPQQLPWEQSRQPWAQGQNPGLGPWARPWEEQAHTRPAQYAPGGSARAFTPNALPITTAGSIGGTQNSPVGQAMEGGSGITAPGSPTGAQPQAQANAAQPQARPRARQEDLAAALRANG